MMIQEAEAMRSTRQKNSQGHVFLRKIHFSRGKGFILVFCLYLIAIAAVVLTGVSRLSLLKVLECLNAQEELQIKWAKLTATRTLLPLAPKILEIHEKRLETKVSSVDLNFVLGSIPHRVIIGDEQAKLNVNEIGRRYGKDQVALAVTNVLRVSLLAANLDLSPAEPSRLQPGWAQTGFPAYGSFEQVFGTIQPEALMGTRGKKPGLAAHVTCWGNGKLNYARASESVIREVTSRILGRGKLSALIELRDRPNPPGLSETLALLELTKEIREQLSQVLTDQSLCHSIWIALETKGSAHYHFAVLDHSPAEEWGVQSFEW